MKNLFLSATFLIGCSTVSPVEICGPENCATGFFDGSKVVSAGHAFEDGDEATVRTGVGFEDVGRIKTLENDKAEIETRVDSKTVCYGTVKARDLVTVSTLPGPVRTRVAKVFTNGFVVDKILRHGDSGSAVTRRGCVVGRVHGLGYGGTVAVIGK